MVVSFDGVNEKAVQYVTEGKITCIAECNPLHGPRVQALIEALEAGETPEKFSYVDEQFFSAYQEISELTVDGIVYPITFPLVEETAEKGQEIAAYDKPNRYLFNVQPASGETDIIEYGERISKIFKAIVNIRYKNKFNEGDIAYLDGVVPNDKNTNYNYKIVSVRNQNRRIAIYFERIQK